jgi:branched-chain amino acid transport system ATP-binding protein
MNQQSATETILAVENISLSFGVMKVLDSISFDIKRGEIRSIIGPNGAGKSSMLNVINGFYHPQEGSITYKGETRKQMAPHVAASHGIARTFQNIALFKGMSTLDNIMTGRNLKMKTNLFWQALHIGPARLEELENREAAEKIIDFLDIQAIRKKPVGKLPYGLQKRVELGRALAAEPDLLLLDEPMAGMNSEEKEDMSRFIIDVTWTCRTAFWCSTMASSWPMVCLTRYAATRTLSTPTWGSPMKRLNLVIPALSPRTPIRGGIHSCSGTKPWRKVRRTLRVTFQSPGMGPGSEAGATCFSVAFRHEVIN